MSAHTYVTHLQFSARDDAHARERPGVVGLTAARRMKGRAIEHDAQAARVDLDDVGVEREA